MRRIPKFKTLISSLLILLIFTSFKSIHSIENYSKEDWIPKDFFPKNGTLLVENHPYSAKYNEGLIKFLEEHYPWEFEVVSVGDANGDKYADKKKYQFMIQWTDVTNGKYHDLEGHFLDLTNDKRYPDSGYATNRGQSTYKKLFSVLVKKFKGG